MKAPPEPRTRPGDLESRPGALPKAPTGISGLDEVTGGGLPRGRPTLVCGPAGCGKTLLAMEFIVRGITEFDEPADARRRLRKRSRLGLQIAGPGAGLG